MKALNWVTHNSLWYFRRKTKRKCFLHFWIDFVFFSRSVCDAQWTRKMEMKINIWIWIFGLQSHMVVHWRFGREESLQLNLEYFQFIFKPQPFQVFFLAKRTIISSYRYSECFDFFSWTSSCIRKSDFLFFLNVIQWPIFRIEHYFHFPLFF